MADPAPAAAPAAPQPNIPAADGAGPWHSGVDTDTVGFWENKGWGKDNPKDLAVNMTKSYREMEKHFGTPADQLLKMPKQDADPKDIKAFWQRLGVPADAKEYDFSTVKINGEPLDAGFEDVMRQAMAQAYIPKDKATMIADAWAKAAERDFVSKQAARDANLKAEQTNLRTNWGKNFDFNHLKAMEGARRLGIAPEAVTTLENGNFEGVGYAAVMEMFRKIGAGTTEDMFVDRGASGANGPDGVPATREGAQARLNELMGDPNWGARLTKGDVEAKREWMNLLTMIEGTT